MEKAKKKQNETIKKRSKYTIFKNPPITEAIFDIRVELPDNIKLDDLEKYHDLIKDRYMEKKQRISFKSGFKVEPGNAPEIISSENEPDGYIFQSPNEKKIIQVRLDGFTFNKLKPYENWDKFYSEAKILWEEYVKLTKPIKIIRIALRYINQVDIPLPFKNFKEYIKTIPDIAPKLPQGLSEFFMRLVIPNKQIEAFAIITETMKDPTLDKKLPFIFDIDVFKTKDYKDNDPQIWIDFLELCNYINQIFSNSMTNKAKELFK